MTTIRQKITTPAIDLSEMATMAVNMGIARSPI
jgi:hypothetical protein